VLACLLIDRSVFQLCSQVLSLVLFCFLCTMGCMNSSGKVMVGGSSKVTNLERLLPDPDLGWRRVIDIHPDASFGPASSTENIYPFGSHWKAAFFNDRSGNFCEVSVLVVAINIAVRATQLARSFGVVSEMEAVPNIPPSGDVVDDERKIYRALCIPDYNWKLLERLHKPRGSRQAISSSSSRRQHVGADDTSPKNPGDNPVVPIQKIQRGSGTPVVADVSEIGMNIAEQLFRLEKGQGERFPMPQDNFGWTAGSVTDGYRVMVSSPESDAYWLIPEELIMNVTTWVQQTYLTQPGF